MKTLLILAVCVAVTGCTYTSTSLSNPRKLTRVTVVEINGYTYYQTAVRGTTPTPDTLRRCFKEAREK